MSNSKKDLPQPPAMTSSLLVEEAPLLRSMTIGDTTAVRVPSLNDKQRLTHEAKSPDNLENEEINMEDYIPGKKDCDNTSLTIERQRNRSNWNVQEDSVRPLPFLYPLERSSRIISNMKASDIAARISNCLRIMSVAAQYDDDSALLKTPDYVEMYVHLFQGNHATSSDGIIVEVQRRKGCSVLFHKYSRHVLDAAEGTWNEELYQTNFNSDISPVAPESTEAEDKAKKHENVLLALEIAGGLLKKDRIDANRLGMESLCLLTDPRKTGAYTAAVASRIVLMGTAGFERNDVEKDLDNESHFNIREAVLSLIQKRRLNDDSTFEEEDAHPEEKEHMDLLHNLALAVLANALDDIASIPFSESDAANTLLNDSKLKDGQDLVSTLIESLKLAETHPHDAFLSAKCLRVLIEASEEARERARTLNALTVVNKAKDIGRGSHALLAQETENALTALNNHY